MLPPAQQANQGYEFVLDPSSSAIQLRVDVSQSVLGADYSTQVANAPPTKSMSWQLNIYLKNGAFLQVIAQPSNPGPSDTATNAFDDYFYTVYFPATRDPNIYWPPTSSTYVYGYDSSNKLPHSAMAALWYSGGSATLRLSGVRDAANPSLVDLQTVTFTTGGASTTIDLTRFFAQYLPLQMDATAIASTDPSIYFPRGSCPFAFVIVGTGNMDVFCTTQGAGNTTYTGAVPTGRLANYMTAESGNLVFQSASSFASVSLPNICNFAPPPPPPCQPQACPLGYHWDSTACACLPNTPPPCQPPSGGCPPGYYWDQTTCSCLPNPPCQAQPCPTGYHWDSALCQCVQDSSPPPPNPSPQPTSGSLSGQVLAAGLIGGGLLLGAWLLLSPKRPLRIDKWNL